MKLRKGSFDDFARSVRSSGKQIIVYGAGVIGQLSAPYWLREYGLEDAVLCYVDADPRKQGGTVQAGAWTVPIQSLEALDQSAGEYILLITVSAFSSVIDALEQRVSMRDVEAYFLPVMLVDIAHAEKAGGVVKTSDKPLIPKVIHYCWFSGKPIPEPLQKCIDSWRKYCPDYEIVRWDESNYDINQYPYMKEAYEREKWGFVSDLARMDILYRHGGIYLDTDVELIRNLDELLYQPAFCGTETWGTVNSGGGIGSQLGNPVIRDLLEYRKNERFICEDGTLNLTACGFYETPPLLKYGLRLNGSTQVIADGAMTVYASDFFIPFDYMSGELRITKNTFSIHYYSGTWMGPDAAKVREETRHSYNEFLCRLG